jgi:NTE family protein
VGVVKALDELGLRPDLIVGASAGAVVAVLSAAGMSGRAIAELVMTLQPWMLARLAFGAEERLSGAGLAQWMRERTGDRALHELSIPVATVARRKGTDEVVAFNHGDAGLAVQASAAIEGQFTPVRIRGELYADADLVQPLPVRVARALGAQRVLGVDASAWEDRAPQGTEAWRAGDLRKRALTEPDARVADVLLHPDTGYYAGMSQAYRARTIEIGYRSTLAAADALRKLHA